MMLKLLKVKELEDSKFEIVFRQNGHLKSVIIVRNRYWIDEIQDYLSVINSEDADFSNLWGHHDFRKEVSEAIKNLVEKKELQAI